MLPRNHLLHSRYRIIRPLGKGGFGQVYEALDDKLDCIVAIKESHVNLESDEMRRAFEREAKLLANLRHPVLPKVTDHFFEGDGQFLVMEYIEGDDLLTLLSKRQRPFTVGQILPWADELLKALEFLHTRAEKVIHRDIKPANIKVAGAGEIFLLDFGLAKGAAGMMSVPAQGQDMTSVRGYTAAYAPIEQLSNSGTDEQSDIYSLGASLYHLLTARIPATAAQRYENLDMGKPDPLIPLHEANPDVPLPVSSVISQAMAMSRRDRLGSASKMRKALKDARIKIEKSFAATFTDVPGPQPSGHRSTVEAFWGSDNVPATQHGYLSETNNPGAEGRQTFPTSTPDEQVSWPSQVGSESSESPPPSPANDDRVPTLLFKPQAEANPDEVNQQRLLDEQLRLQAEAEAAEDATRKAAQEAERLRVEFDAREKAEAERLRLETEARQRAQQGAWLQAQAIARQNAEYQRQVSWQSPEQARGFPKPRPRRGLIVVVAIGLVLIIGGVLVLLLMRDRKTESQTASDETSAQALPAATSKANSLTLSRSLTGPQGKVWSVAFSPDNGMAAAAGEDKRILIWDADSWQLRLRVGDQRADINSISFSPNSRLIASGSSDRSIKLFSTLDGTVVKELLGHQGKVLFVAFSPNGRLLASSSADRTARLWNAETGNKLLTLEKHADEVWSVAFSPDGATLATAGKDRTIRLWDVGTGEEIRTIATNGPLFVTFSSDGSTLASGHSDNTIKLWNWKTGESLKTLAGHSDYVTSIAFSPDGLMLASGSKDKSIKLWDVRTGGNTQTLSGHGGSVESIGYSPSGKSLISGSQDKTVNVWQ